MFSAYARNVLANLPKAYSNDRRSHCVRAMKFISYACSQPEAGHGKGMPVRRLWTEKSPARAWLHLRQLQHARRRGKGAVMSLVGKSGNGHSALGAQRAAGRLWGTGTQTDTHEAAVGHFEIAQTFIAHTATLTRISRVIETAPCRAPRQRKQTLRDRNYRSNRLLNRQHEPGQLSLVALIG
jgi:hypothetical protein